LLNGFDSSTAQETWSICPSHKCHRYKISEAGSSLCDGRYVLWKFSICGLEKLVRYSYIARLNSNAAQYDYSIMAVECIYLTILFPFMLMSSLWAKWWWDNSFRSGN
jgi:hypothetical protein